MRPAKHVGVKTGCQGSCCLKVENVSVTLGETEILKNVNFHLHCGELVALIGPNGAGKSSLFKTILGQLPYSGSITFQESTGIHRRPRIGYVPQSPTFDPDDPVSVLDLFVASISKWPVFLPIPEKLRNQVSDCLKRVHGEALIDKRIGTLSGGELQRVLLAMALEPIPNILILDEPLSGVDVTGERELLEMLDELRTVYDLSILLSTHDFNTLQLVDKVILLKGEVLTVGTPQEVMNSPEFHQIFLSHLGPGGDEA